jgi:hypothetical protein
VTAYGEVEVWFIILKLVLVLFSSIEAVGGDHIPRSFFIFSCIRGKDS